MAVALDPLAELTAQLEDAASDPELDAIERVRRIQDLRDRIEDLLGAADRYLIAAQRVRESGLSEAARDRLRARELADLREAAVVQGVPVTELDEAGLLSHAELDRLDEEGLLEEAVAGFAMRTTHEVTHQMIPFDSAKHPHGAGGRFEDTADAPAPAKDARGAGQKVDERYRDYFHEHPDALLAHADRLRPTRDDTPEHVAKARRNLDRAKAGLMNKRKPLEVAENGDGTLSILDGNSTFAALSKEGLTHFPVTINHDVADAGDAAVGRVADEIAANAEGAERDVTPALKNVVSEKGGKLVGLEHRLKTRESIASKVKRKQDKYPGLAANLAGAKVLDAVRYTAVYPKENYVDGISQVMSALQAKGFEARETKNYWGQGDDYDGYHVILRGPKDVAVELQFHTPETLAVKTKQHPLYASFRESTDAKERYKLWQQMTELAAATPKPPGLEQLGPARPSPSAEERTRRHEAPGLSERS